MSWKISYIIIIVLIIVGVSGYFIVNQQTQKPISPVIESISPQEAPINTEISIKGSGFTSAKNSLHFGNGFAYINNLVSSDGKTMKFTLPESFDVCNPDGSVCAEFLSRPFPGQTYEVVVINVNGRSNSMDFTVAREEGPPNPTPTQNGERIIKGVGEREGSFLIQQINPDSVEGLWYQAYPVQRDDGEPRTLLIGDDIGYACENVSEKLASIDFTAQRITFIKVVGEPPYGGCPICLSGDTLIDTPSGNINVKELRSGMLVWTSDRLRNRQLATILEVGRSQVPQTHEMVRIILNNGKELFVSQGHPTADGRIFGDIVPGDIVDNSFVKSVNIVPYNQKFTYDILPSGDTGFYWANGILVGSTLK